MFISLKYILRSKIRSSKIKIRGNKIQIRRKIKIHGSKIKIRGSKIKICWKIKIDDSKKDKKIAGSFLLSAGRPTCPANVLFSYRTGVKIRLYDMPKFETLHSMSPKRFFIEIS